MRLLRPALLLVATINLSATAADIPTLVRPIRAVGAEGAGNAEAARTWRELSHLPASELPQLLAALDGASPAAVNWLSTAIGAIAERERVSGHPLPAAALDAFLRDTRHSGRGRKLAYDLLCAADPTAPKRLLPTMLDDPGAELRFEAVQAAFDAVKARPTDSSDATAELRRLLSVARYGGQVEATASELKRRGSPVDLVAHFGFITRWQVVGPFDNADGRGFRTALPPERGADLAARYAGKGGVEVAWRPAAADKAGVIDLNRLFPAPAGGRSKGPKAVVAYAYAEVDSPAARDVEVRAASATAVKVFVNGREVLARETYHQSFDRDMHTAPARLVKGRNTVLVKVCQNDQPEDWAQNWMFQLRLTDALGAAVPVMVVTPGVAP